MPTNATAGRSIVLICAVGAFLLGFVVAPLTAPGNMSAVIVPAAIGVFLGWQVVRMRSANHQRQDAPGA